MALVVQEASRLVGQGARLWELRGLIVMEELREPHLGRTTWHSVPGIKDGLRRWSVHKPGGRETPGYCHAVRCRGVDGFPVPICFLGLGRLSKGL